jgi:hypothetical protein
MSANADFNGDGFSGLAVGVPYADLGPGLDNAGAVHVIYGSAAGLTAADNQIWTQGGSLRWEKPEANDLFGSSLNSSSFSERFCLSRSYLFRRLLRPVKQNSNRLMTTWKGMYTCSTSYPLKFWKTVSCWQPASRWSAEN